MLIFMAICNRFKPSTWEYSIYLILHKNQIILFLLLRRQVLGIPLNWLNTHLNLHHSFLRALCLWCPAESSPAGAGAASVSAGLRRSQCVRVLQPAVAALLPPLRAAVPLRRPGGSPGRRRRRRHPHPGQARRAGRGAAAAEPPAAAPPRLQEPGGWDPHHGQEETERRLQYDTAA